MSTEVPDTVTRSADNERRPSRRKRAAAVLALFALGAAGVGVAKGELSGHGDAQPGVASPDHPTKPKPEHHKKPGPVSVEKLAGYGQPVTPEQRKAIQASTVQVIRLKQHPGADFPTQTFCTGLKIEVGGTFYVATARHCIIDEGSDTVAEFPDMYKHGVVSGPSQNAAKIIPESLSGAISIWTLDSKGKPDAQHPIPADKAVAVGNQDFALLRIAQDSPAASQFDAVPAIDYEQGILGTPEPGAQVAMYSAPGLGSIEFREATGTFLGSSPIPGDTTTEMDWVLVDDGSAVEGNSGESGALSGPGAMITGPLSMELDNRDAARVAAGLGVKIDSPHTKVVGFGAVTTADVNRAAQLIAAP